jgi:monoamine oxidase
MDPDWPYELSAEERRLGLQGLWSKYVIPIVARVEDPSSPGWPDDDARKLDNDTLNDLLRKKGATEAVISVLRMTFLGEDYDHVSALQDLVWQPFIERNKKWMHLRDGNDIQRFRG